MKIVHTQGLTRPSTDSRPSVPRHDRCRRTILHQADAKPITESRFHGKRPHSPLVYARQRARPSLRYIRSHPEDVDQYLSYKEEARPRFPSLRIVSRHIHCVPPLNCASPPTRGIARWLRKDSTAIWANVARKISTICTRSPSHMHICASTHQRSGIGDGGLRPPRPCIEPARGAKTSDPLPADRTVATGLMQRPTEAVSRDGVRKQCRPSDSSACRLRA
jgi:hypothetical protein